MVRRSRLLAVLLVVLAFSLGWALPAHADSGDDVYRRYVANVTTDAEGVSQVDLEFDLDFGADSGHGPFLTLVTRQADDRNEDVWRLVQIDGLQVSSPSGAPANVKADESDGVLSVRIGHPDLVVSGVQTYRVSYRARGLIAPDHATSGLDEFNWSALGTGWQTPLENITVRVAGPVPAQRVACFQGARYDRPCSITSDASGTTASVSRLEPGQGLQVVAGYPVGTFVGAEPVYEKRYHVTKMFGLTPLSVGATAGLTALGLAAVAWVTRGWGRSRMYAGVTPGLEPAEGSSARTVVAPREVPQVVQFHPPAGVRPGEVGVLTDRRADRRDAVATLLDLAARGHLRIERDGSDWAMAKADPAPNDELTDPEVFMLDELFQKGDRVTTADLAARRYSDVVGGTVRRLQGRVDGLGWYETKGGSRVVALVFGILSICLFSGIGLLLAFTSNLGLIGLAFIVVGVALVVRGTRPLAHLPAGYARLVQSKGFEHYLRTAEADQIRFEEGMDVFSRYLPYATVYGVADRWVALFAELARQGRWAPTSDAFGAGGVTEVATFTNSLSDMTHSFTTAIAASESARAAQQASVSSSSSGSSGSSGGSGFSGGGGFGGGGGGSW